MCTVGKCTVGKLVAGKCAVGKVVIWKFVLSLNFVSILHKTVEEVSETAEDVASVSTEGVRDVPFGKCVVGKCAVVKCTVGKCTVGK